MSDQPLAGPLTRADAYAIIRSRFSREDIRNLVAAADGAAMVDSILDVLADESARLDRAITARHLLPRGSDVNPIASGEAFAAADVVIERSPSSLGVPIVMIAGTKVATSDGHVFALAANVPFAAPPFSVGPPELRTPVAKWASGSTSLDPSFGTSSRATAVIAGYASTSIAGSIDSFLAIADGANGDVATVELQADGFLHLVRGAGDVFTASMVGLYVHLSVGANAGKYALITRYMSPEDVQIVGAEHFYDATIAEQLVGESAAATWSVLEWADLGFTVSQASDTSQGCDDGLDALGREVNRHRQDGELDGTLLGDLLHISDAVSVDAILSAANAVLGAYGPVWLYEQGTCAIDADPLLGLRAFPGCVADVSPCDVAPDALDLPDPGTSSSRPPLKGLAIVGRTAAYFLLRWDGAGLGETGGYAGDYGSSGVSVSDPVPFGAAADVSPADGGPFGDAAIRRAIAAAINGIKGGGVAWGWAARRYFTP